VRSEYRPFGLTRWTRAKSPWGMLGACLLIVFLVLFPKGGFRLGPLPLTWGYLLLGIVTPPAFLIRFLQMPLRFPRRVLLVTFLLIPMQLLFWYAGKFYGISNPPFAFATFVGLFALPWIFLLIYGPFFPRLDGEQFAKLFCFCVFYAASWGIFLFFLHPIAHRFIEVPYLTVNASDYGELESTKNIGRGFFYKLISTYNNGNLYGVATLLLLPIYQRLEPSRMRRATVKVALFLSLSRTVWVGLILNELLSLGVHLFRQVPTFPVLFLGAARRRFFAVGAIIGFILFSVLFISAQGGGLQFLLDLTGGNRVNQIYAAQGTSFLPQYALYGFAEILYASAAQYWGISGLIAFTLIMVSPLIVLASQPSLMNYPLRRAAAKGLIIYIAMAGIDGALDFIPVMAFYWFVYAVLLYGWPGDRPLVLPEDQRGASWIERRMADLAQRLGLRRPSSALARVS
jgi:hypothetical protein